MEKPLIEVIANDPLERCYDVIERYRDILHHPAVHENLDDDVSFLLQVVAGDRYVVVGEIIDSMVMEGISSRTPSGLARAFADSVEAVLRPIAPDKATRSGLGQVAVVALELDLDVAKWYPRAKCRKPGIDSEIFFPSRRAAEAASDAKKVCGSCMARAECLEYALEEGFPAGVWGGYTSQERKKMDKDTPFQRGQRLKEIIDHTYTVIERQKQEDQIRALAGSNNPNHSAKSGPNTTDSIELENNVAARTDGISEKRVKSFYAGVNKQSGKELLVYDESTIEAYILGLMEAFVLESKRRDLAELQVCRMMAYLGGFKDEEIAARFGGSAQSMGAVKRSMEKIIGRYLRARGEDADDWLLGKDLSVQPEAESDVA